MSGKVKVYEGTRVDGKEKEKWNENCVVCIDLIDAKQITFAAIRWCFNNVKLATAFFSAHQRAALEHGESAQPNRMDAGSTEIRRSILISIYI